MKLKMRGLPYLLLSCLALSTPAVADIVYIGPQISPYRFEGIGALGLANLRAGDSNIGVTASETDRLVQSNGNNWDTTAAQLGVGYIYYFRDSPRYTNETRWFTAIEPQLNLYHLAGHSLNGDVWRFSSSAFNQLTFDIPVRSTRLMLDAALTVVARNRLSLYVLGGVGNAWNRVGYSDTDNGGTGCPNQRLNLDKNNSSNFAWEAGLGLVYALTNRVGLSLGYLYSDLGKVRTASSGNTGTITAPVLVPARFNLKSQTGLLGIHVAFG